MAKRLVENGHEVHMVTSVRESIIDKKDWHVTIEDGIQVHWFPIPCSNEMSFGARKKAFFTFALASAKKASSIKADIVIAKSAPLTIAFPAIYAAKKQKIPMVFEVGDLWPELPIAVGAVKNPIMIWAAKRMEKWAYRNAKYVVAFSPGIKEGIVRCGYPENQVSIIPNGCDLDLFGVDDSIGHEFRKRYDWLGDRKLIAYVGTFGLINGVGYLARLAKEVACIDNEIRFLAVGQGAEFEKVKKLSIELGVLGRSFFMLPSIAKKDVPAVLNAASIAISLFIDLKEMWHNSANKFFDALAAAKPIAINYQGWQAEIIRRNNIGVVLDPVDIKRSAWDLVEFLNNKELLNDAGKYSRRIAETEFSRDILANKLETILLDAVK
jgi:glycosyltransferase involved in cell wall biosynthesis